MSRLLSLPQCLVDILVYFLDYPSLSLLCQLSKRYSALYNSDAIWSTALCREGWHDPRLLGEAVTLAHVKWRSRYQELTKAVKQGRTYTVWTSGEKRVVHEEYKLPPLRLLSWQSCGNLYKDFISRFWPLTMKIWFDDEEGRPVTTRVVSAQSPCRLDVHIAITNHSSTPREILSGRGFQRDRAIRMDLVSGHALEFYPEEKLGLHPTLSACPDELDSQFIGKMYSCGTGMTDFVETIAPYSTSQFLTQMSSLQDFAFTSNRTYASRKKNDIKLQPKSQPRQLLRTNYRELDALPKMALVACIDSGHRDWTCGSLALDFACCSNLLTIHFASDLSCVSPAKKGRK